MKRYVFPTIAVICIAAGFFIGHATSVTAKAESWRWNKNSKSSNNKVEQLLNYMETEYVEQLNMDSITDEALTVLVSQLDPHSSYIPKEDIDIVNSELGASFSGIGVQFSIQNDTVSIISVISGGPSEGVGVLAGDKIVEVDDSVFVGKKINNEKVMHALRGEKGTNVKIGVVRSGAKEILHYNITRGEIPVHSVDAAFNIAPQVGYVKVNKFSETTYEEFLSALAKLKASGAQSYIVDLRENSGGYMDKAIRMSNEFLEVGDMIVYSEGKSHPRYTARAFGNGRFKDVPLVVLIDEFSASASEIFAGAMQDNDRATIIGRRSFGKGLVQQQYPFADGSALRLTIARYYTPSGRCIQKPYKLGDQLDYQKDLIDRFEKGEFFSADSIHQDTVKYYTKKGRVVHGGGGIMPDIFIGRDTTLNTPYYNSIVNHAYTYQFAYQYTDKNRKVLSEYKDWQSLEKYLKQHDWLPELVSFCKAKGVEPNPKELKKSEPLLRRLVNAYIVRNVLGDEGFYPLYERDDEVVKKAIEVLKK